MSVDNIYEKVFKVYNGLKCENMYFSHEVGSSASDLKERKR